ncbi:heme-binding domain-containing protein [Iamia sp. SCSIO 61187]|uniref:heme-binding domain-containing protein n=1 Tax=Iamia sp. SCSIO 61187 TaxID=2722752 RepID=UPI001C625599|nr:heme-binding domain-containing protein [Iamia sp. SCSIO 61187]QYG91438.1 heme-binding domain-containing protein [Iamia sp. SCSIO 61187]
MSRRAAARRVVVVGGAGLVFVVGLMQLVPYGWTKTNPPVTADAPWPDAESEAIARESCYSCHSNETDWPAYSYLAPMSWLVRRDVDRGREELNFSEWGERSDAGDAADEVEDGAMPPRQYTVIHRGARLTEDEARVLATALERMDDEGG